MPKLLSGRVGVTSYAGISTSRYEWLGLSEAEPNLNVPAQNDYALFSDVDGNMIWIYTKSTYKGELRHSRQT